MTSDRKMPQEPGWWWATYSIPGTTLGKPVRPRAVEVFTDEDGELVGDWPGVCDVVTRSRWAWIRPIPAPDAPTTADVLREVAGELRDIADAHRLLASSPHTNSDRKRGSAWGLDRAAEILEARCDE